MEFGTTAAGRCPCATCRRRRTPIGHHSTGGAGADVGSLPRRQVTLLDDPVQLVGCHRRSMARRCRARRGQAVRPRDMRLSLLRAGGQAGHSDQAHRQGPRTMARVALPLPVRCRGGARTRGCLAGRPTAGDPPTSLRSTRAGLSGGMDGVKAEGLRRGPWDRQESTTSCDQMPCEDLR